MRLHIVGSKQGLDRATWECVKSHFAFALGPYADRVGLVTVYLTDEDGPAGGVDRLCRIVAELPGFGAAVVEVSDRDPAALLERAVRRLEQAVRRRMANMQPFAALPPSGSVAEWN